MTYRSDERSRDDEIEQPEPLDGLAFWLLMLWIVALMVLVVFSLGAGVLDLIGA